MTLPLSLCRILNLLRRVWEADDRLLVEQWKDTFKPDVKPHRNLLQYRSKTKKVARVGMSAQTVSPSYRIEGRR